MQGLTDDVRDGLDPNLVSGLLQGDPAIRVTYGALWYNSEMALVDDITGYMSNGSTVSSDVTATIHRSCSLVFDSNVPFNSVTDFVQPYMVLTNPDTGYSAQFNLGVYTLATPNYDNSALPSVLTFTGYDLLYLLNQPVGDSYEVAAGQDPVVAAALVIDNLLPWATVAYEESGETLTGPLSFPFDDSDQYTYLQIINALLASAGYAPLWVDWNGVFQMHKWDDPLQADIEWTFDLNAQDNIIAEPRTSTQDLFSVPNWWRFVIQNLQVPAVEGVSQFTYIDQQAENPGSYPNRKRYVRKTQFLDATSYAALFTQGLIQIQADLSPGESFSVTSSPFPLAWHKDIIQYVDNNLSTIAPAYANYRRVQAMTWKITLDGTADMEWSWQTVNVTLAQQDYSTY